jgi:hypothetical protein
MTQRISRRVLRQLHLFRSRPQLPRWEQLPDDVRRTALPLVALLLRSALQASREANDER